MAKREQWLLEARKRLEWIQQHVSGGRLLEVGSATGEFVSVAEGSGFDVVGLETSTWAATASRDITQRVVCADPEDWLPSQEGQFDAVAAFHTLEHVHDPSAFLSALSRALRPGGLVFLEVPNGAARDMRDGERWLGARLPDHVLHYRPEDLRRLCGSTELAVRELSPLTMREFDSSLVWLLRRGRWLARGRLAASEDFLRLVAVKA